MTSQTFAPLARTGGLKGLAWQGSQDVLKFDDNGCVQALLALESPVWAVSANGHTALTGAGQLTVESGDADLLALAPAVPLESLGDPAFCTTYGTRYALYGGAMANAIASLEMVVALGKAGMLGSFGAAGLSPERVEEAIRQVQAALPDGPYAFNLINNPFEPAMELRAAELYVRYDVPAVEASAYLDITPGLVHYRASGLARNADGSIAIRHHIIAKLSRKEVARRFLSPAPQELLAKLAAEGKISPTQAELARQVPMADDITVEADSGGHTDNRPLVGLLPSLIALRDELQAQFQYPAPVRIGAAGGISTPSAALAAFMMGAAYVVTGSVNQACVEAGSSAHTKALLAQVEMPDVTMAPAADMFEMGVRVQVLKRGTLFAMRASKLYELYTRYNAWEEVPADERKKLETSVFKRTFEEIWSDTVQFFRERDPRMIERAEKDPRQKMALVFRWYLGLSSRWSNRGEPGREMDYQIWCGPSMGSFNDWAHGTYLSEPANRHVADVALQILTGAAYLARLRALALQGVHLPANLEQYRPQGPLA
ncbi:PfaD family protein [Longilinea arvoryzae]|uniref:PfaD family protein n=1 Tax=Longilinea arvoryzae TaxID=360412 RepID=A0A0S7BLQ7_9CHLR|nr:PfaD family polyunsaturated fatty acid/polyketide biosynthesis protein [Longilinea arvoryzae]GAP15603.1 PfaD family protein [Longilinea arvoryzae]